MVPLGEPNPPPGARGWTAIAADALVGEPEPPGARVSQRGRQVSPTECRASAGRAVPRMRPYDSRHGS